MWPWILVAVLLFMFLLSLIHAFTKSKGIGLGYLVLAFVLFGFLVTAVKNLHLSFLTR